MLVTNENSDEVVKVDQASGKLGLTGDTIAMSKPTSLAVKAF
jgi:hypothetical protein